MKPSWNRLISMVEKELNYSQVCLMIHISLNIEIRLYSVLHIPYLLTSFLYFFACIYVDIWILKFFLHAPRHGLIFQMSGRLYSRGLTRLVLHCIQLYIAGSKVIGKYFNLSFFYIKKIIWCKSVLFQLTIIAGMHLIFWCCILYLITAECYKEYK